MRTLRRLLCAGRSRRQHVDRKRARPRVRERIGLPASRTCAGRWRGGKRAIMLVDGGSLNGGADPHWVYVWGIVGDCA